MKHAIITVEIADPDFADICREFARERFDRTKTNVDAELQRITEYWSAARWRNQIMRVHRYNCNLPAIMPANRNRPY